MGRVSIKAIQAIADTYRRQIDRELTHADIAVRDEIRETQRRIVEDAMNNVLAAIEKSPNVAVEWSGSLSQTFDSKRFVTEITIVLNNEELADVRVLEERRKKIANYRLQKLRDIDEWMNAAIVASAKGEELPQFDKSTLPC